jgi:hypothetical protein
VQLDLHGLVAGGHVERDLAAHGVAGGAWCGPRRPGARVLARAPWPGYRGSTGRAGRGHTSAPGHPWGGPALVWDGWSDPDRDRRQRS